MKLIPFEPVHMLWVKDIHENVIDEQRGMDLVKLGERCKAKGPCATLIDAEAIACGGIAFIFKETGEIWLRLSLKGRGPNAVREIKVQMFRWIEEYHLDRLQATAQARWQEDCDFLEWLGMKPEGLMRKFGPHGLDQYRYAWVRP
jgi:hypothetical protein